jgi:hypothetical protein
VIPIRLTGIVSVLHLASDRIIWLWIQGSTMEMSATIMGGWQNHPLFANVIVITVHQSNPRHFIAIFTESRRIVVH